MDDFIVEDKHEKLVHDAWAECMSNLPRTSEGEVRIPEGYTCDYEDTEVFRSYLGRQKNEIWADVNKYSSSPFKRFARHQDEKRLVNEGSCPYREVWLKKYFSQKMVQKAQSQFGNFLGFPSVTSRVVKPIDEDVDYVYTAMKVDAVDENCIDQGLISAKCIHKTNKYDLSVSDFSENLLNKDNRKNVQDYFVSPRRELDDTPYKPILDEFYSKYSRRTLRQMRTIDDPAVADSLSKDIYKTLVSIAAPPVNLHPRINYQGKLQQIAPADFGRDVQKFMCNIMLPRADKAFHEFFEWYDQASEDDMAAIGASFEQPGAFETFRAIVSANDRRGLLYDRFKRALNRCHERANSDSVEVALPFHIERKFRTLELGRYFFRGGKSINFTVSQGVGVSHGLSVSNKYSLDPINSFKDLVNNIPVIGNIVGFFAGMLKFHDYQQSESNGVGDSLGLGTSAHLSMQAAELDLELLKYRRCMLVRWNKEFLRSSGVLHESISVFQHILPQMNNVFVCGNEENEPIAIRENYYYVTQHFTEGDLLDSGSLLNNPWLLTLRGYRDMIAFVKSIYPDDENFLGDKDGDGNQDGLPVWQLMKDDLDRMTSARPFFVPVSLREATERGTFENQLDPWKTMSIGYRSVTPSFPGLFTQLSNREVSIPNWPWTNEGQLREQGDRSCDAQLLENSNQDGQND